MTRADSDKQPRQVAAMFDAVARRYDLTNAVLSLGQEARWRRATHQALDVVPGQRVLDLAAGTGTSSAVLADAGGRVVACDFSLGMLQVGRERHRDLELVAGDAACLPFADDTFDAVTISFGLRNVQDPDAALAELARVTRPGGRLVVCEFSQPVWRPFALAYSAYLGGLLPTVARAVASNPEAYLYLADSIRHWPGQLDLARRIQAAGWRQVAYRNLSGGIVALHRATKADQ